MPNIDDVLSEQEKAHAEAKEAKEALDLLNSQSDVEFLDGMVQAIRDRRDEAPHYEQLVLTAMIQRAEAIIEYLKNKR